MMTAPLRSGGPQADTALNNHMHAFSSPAATSTASRLAGYRWLLACLLCLLFLPLTLPWLAPMAGIAVPAWLAPATAGIALACLFAMLAIAWRAGALRGRFVLAFAAALLLLPAARHFPLI